MRKRGKLKSQRLNAPKAEHAKESTRRHELGWANVRDVNPKLQTKLKRVRKKMVDRYNTSPMSDLMPVEDVPDMKPTGRKYRVAEVSASNSWQFYNPAEGIAQAIRDSMDVDKVYAQAPRQCEVEGDVEPRESGFKIAVKYVIEERETAKLYMLQSGRTMWLPKGVIMDEGRYFVVVPKKWRWKIEALRIPPKPGGSGLSKDEAKRRLLAMRKK